MTYWTVSGYVQGQGGRPWIWRQVTMIQRLIDAVKRWRIRREVMKRAKRYVGRAEA